MGLIVLRQNIFSECQLFLMVENWPQVQLAELYSAKCNVAGTMCLHSSPHPPAPNSLEFVLRGYFLLQAVLAWSSDQEFVAVWNTVKYVS